MLKIYVEPGMIVDKIHQIVSLERSKWLEKSKSFNTQKRNGAKNDFEKEFYSFINIAFHAKTTEKLRERINVEFIRKDANEKNIKQQSNLTFNGYINLIQSMIVIQSSKMKSPWKKWFI